MSVIKQNCVVPTMDIVMNLSSIEVYNSTWKNRKIDMKPEFLDSLRSSGAYESIGSSNRIEGNTLTNEEIKKLLEGLSTKSFRTRDEAEVAGYSEALRLIYDNYNNIPLTESYIKQLHGTLLQYTDKDERHRGEYKKVDNAVASFDANGREIGIVFRTATPFDTPFLMTDLVAQTNDMLNDSSYSKLVTIALFIVHFLAIHPFQDGNGRLSRLLTILLLLKTGYGFVEYYSLEKIIEEEKSLYYGALRLTQGTFSDEVYNYTPWLSYFTALLKKAGERLDEKIAAYSSDNSFSADERAVMNAVKRLDGVSISRIANESGLSLNVVRPIIRKLVSKGLVEKHGENKGTWYRARLK